MLKVAIKIAEKAHFGQKDKQGAAYIGHPLRVASFVAGKKAKITAILHDVLEDSDYTDQDLIDAGISKDIVSSIILLTREKDITYFDYIRKIRDSKDKVAIKVKLADLIHNLSPKRIISLELRERYIKAREVLLGHE